MESIQKNIIKLPDDIVCLISGFYGEKIPDKLSKDIIDYQLLKKIKKENYYKGETNTWHVENVLLKLMIKPYYTMERGAKLFAYIRKHNFIYWPSFDKRVNFLWSMYSSEERKEIFEKKFNMSMVIE
jgi:hypothetical protein